MPRGANYVAGISKKMSKTGDIAEETAVYACSECGDHIGVRKGEQFPICRLTCCPFYEKPTRWYLTLADARL